MLYLAIDQHRKQLTVNLRNEAGIVLLKRQVSTQWQKVRTFLAELSEQSAQDGGWVAIVEVCGFNDWLLKELKAHGCHEIVIVQPTSRSSKKTDRRDAASLGEILWVNRENLLAGRRVQQVRRVVPPSAEDQQDRQLTAFRRRLGQLRTRTLNKIQHILLRHNLQQECPTKGSWTKRARGWLESLSLPEMDRFEMNQLLAQWILWDQQIEATGVRIAERQRLRDDASIAASIPGVGAFTSLGLVSRVGDVRRFPSADSLANYWGLTPTSNNSGDNHRRLGSISREGSSLARFLLGQLTTHVLRRDPAMKAWYMRVRRRRGAKIARVAVMRRLATILWRMLTHREAYRFNAAALA